MQASILHAVLGSKSKTKKAYKDEIRKIRNFLHTLTDDHILHTPVGVLCPKLKLFLRHEHGPQVEVVISPYGELNMDCSHHRRQQEDPHSVVEVTYLHSEDELWLPDNDTIHSRHDIVETSDFDLMQFLTPRDPKWSLGDTYLRAYTTAVACWSPLQNVDILDMFWVF